MQLLRLRRVALAFSYSLCVMLTSCVTPETLFRLSPVSTNTIWYYGKELVTHHSEAVDIGIRFNRQEGAYLVFDVDILNLAEQPVLVNPEQFYYVVLQSPTDAESLDITKTPTYAENAEAIVHRIDRTIASARASEANAAIGDGVGLLLGVAADIASSGKQKTKEERQKERDDARKEREERFLRDFNSEKTFKSLADERAHWEFQALRKHTLPSMKSIQGEVYFLLNQKARYMRIYFPIENVNIDFVYKQERVSADGKT